MKIIKRKMGHNKHNAPGILKYPLWQMTASGRYWDNFHYNGHFN